MSKINQIQAAILSLDPGAYQKLMDSYIMRKYGFSNIMPLGSHSGTNKVTKGTPDAFVQCTDGRFILIAHGSVENHAYGKVQSDILNCLDTIKTGIAAEDISQIICCHTSTNFTPGPESKITFLSFSARSMSSSSCPLHSNGISREVEYGLCEAYVIKLSRLKI